MSIGTGDPFKQGAPIERHFFSIARWFGLITTTIALAAVLIGALVGGSKLLNIPDTHIRKPTTAYDDFRRTTEVSRPKNKPPSVDTTLDQKQAEAARASAEAEFEKRLKPNLVAIIDSLGLYASKTDQPKPAAQAIGDYVRSKMKEIERSGSDELMWGYAEGLNKATHDLASDGDRLAKLDVGDPQRVRWDSFVDWYTKSYDQQILADVQRIAAEKTAAVLSAAEAPKYFYAAAIAFSIFVLATILLVLLRIELNTRTGTN